MACPTALGYVRATKSSNGQVGGRVAEHLAAGLPLGDGGPADAADRWIGIEAAARHLAVPTRTMYRLAQRHNVPAVKVGRTWRFRNSTLDAYLERLMLERAPDNAAHAAAAPPIAPSGELGSLESDGWDEMPGELATLAGPGEIARYLDTRLRQIYHVDVVGLMRLQGDDLVALVECDELGVQTGARFTLEPTSPLLIALRRDEPCVIEDLAADLAYQSEPIRRFGLRSLACVPIRFGDQIWGVLALAGFTPGSVRVNDLGRLSAIANQAGLALHNAQLVGDTVRWSQQLERIEALSRELNRSRAVSAVAEAVASQIESVIDWHGLRFYLLAEDGVTLEAIKLAHKVDHYARHTPDLVRLRLGQGLGGHIAATGIAEIVNDAAHDPRTRRIPGTADIDESMIVVPLRYEDSLLGVIELFRLGRGAFDATDLRLAQIVGAQASVAIVNARQVEELERRSAALERRLASQRQLLAITERLLLHREGGAVFEAIADTLAEVVPHDTLTIYLVDRAAGCLVPTLARDEYAEQILASRPALGAGITGDVIEKGEAEIINDVTNDPRAIQIPGTPVEPESMIVAPIRTSEGVIGALSLYRANREFEADDLELVRLFTNHVAIALENASIHDRLIEAAVTDPLTGLPNRRLFSDRVNHALSRRGRTGKGVAVLFLDLDGFKLVNDSLGHATGDEVLAAVGTRLRSCLRTTDTVARLGGDEFAFLLEDIQDDAEAVAAAERVIEALAQPLALPGREVSVRASIGAAVDRGLPGVSAVDLLRNADTAMYQAKATSRGRLALFEPAMHARQLVRLELEGELRQALSAGHLRLVYQPIVALATGQIIGAEALLRWDRPGAPIGPDQFIPLAEETGDIVPIGRWVLAEACQQARRWQRETRLTDFAISVNTSARELAEPRFVAEVVGTLATTGLAPEHLTLEVTESVLLADETAAVVTLRALRAAGVHIAVDDFGTGYSSLSYLDRLPVDGLKIDRSFVHGLAPGRGKSALVSATLGFARALGLTVTAEGVETDEQLRKLQELRCRQAQGFYLSRPLSTESLVELLASGRSYSTPPSPHRVLRSRSAS
jgi:diguanylate cyclase (GGDEF)-like protein/excisionase family DNA binding protein